MKITPFDRFDGDAHAIAIRVAPIDVGFDLRVHGIAVAVPAYTTIASYEHDGVRYVVEGDVDDVLEALHSAGYLTT